MNIEILQPQPWDLVGSTILIGGNAAGFEGHLSIRVSDGHTEITGAARAGSTAIRPFQASLAIPAGSGFRLSRLSLSVSDDSARGGETRPPTVTIPVLYGPLILEGYSGYWEHRVKRGDTLFSLARHYFDGDETMHSAIQLANQHLIASPDTLAAGQVLRIPRAF